MTDWTPDVKIFTLPPNASHDDPRVEVTDWVDYSISASRGTSEYISPPYPAQTVVSLLFEDNVVPDIELGTWIEIQVYSNVISDYAVIHSGFVTNRTSSYRAYGLTGFILEWQFSLTSAISILQNTTWYNEANFTDFTDVCLFNVFSETGRFIWSQINSNTTWANFGPTSWQDVDTARKNTLPNIFIDGELSSQTLTSGFRNVWDDMTTLTYGVYGYLYEEPSGDIVIKFPAADAAPLSPVITITQDMLSTDIVGGDKYDSLRNYITLTEFDDIQSTYFDDNSITLYAERSGTLNTYLNNTLEVANIAQIILNGLSYPLLSTEQITLNLLNPVFTDADRELLLYTPLGQLITVEAPAPMGGTIEYLTIGCQFELNKNAFNLILTLAPYSQARNSPNWDQIPYNYTWTSYGVAFPTQEWQDL
jgi:hypothetical protein